MADPFDAVNIPAEEEVVEPQPPANLIDIKLLQEYIKAVCPVLLDAKPDAFQKVLVAPETQRVIEKFVADSKIPVLFIQKRIETTEADNGMAEDFFLILVYEIFWLVGFPFIFN
jgi:hypothetical protein